ncbi:MAG: sensor histidine kinase [Chitinophagaceae bacterium]|nr:sensor histidine kinase [Chitinophagaceae bacterium]
MDYKNDISRIIDLFDKTSDFIHFLSFDGIIQQVNNTWITNLKYAQDEIQGRHIDEFVHPDYRQAYHDYREKIMNGKGAGERFETALVAKDGKIFYLDGSIDFFYRENGQSYTRAVLKNITQRRKAEIDSLKNEKRLRTIIEHAPDAIIVINEEHEVREWNPKAEQIFGYSKEETLNRLLFELIIPVNLRDAHKAGMQRLLSTGVSKIINHTVEVPAIHKNGSELIVALSITRFEYDHKWNFLAFIDDITKQKQTETELNENKKELEESRILDQQKNEFISIASHELKTPLTTIKAYTQLMRREDEKGNFKNFHQYLEKMDEQTGKLTGLVQQMLDISKIESGQLHYNFTKINLNKFLHDLVGMLHHIITSHPLELQSEIKSTVYIDAFRMEQVFTNLISNAVKYSETGGTITIRAYEVHHEVIIVVSDKGIGIAPEQQQKVFEKFFRVDQNLNKYAGLGIGLFLSKRIVNDHKGKIWIESKVGEGSSFFISLPTANS